MIPNQGTSLSSALNTALTAFTEEFEKFKVVLLVTDGEDHEGEAIDVAKRAAMGGMIIIQLLSDLMREVLFQSNQVININLIKKEGWLHQRLIKLF